MKTTSRSLIKGTNWALAGLLSLLGFACNSDNPDNPDDMMVEYGTPHADYSIKGAVTDALGAPVAGIEIRIKTPEGYPVNEPAHTNGEGKFDVTYGAFPSETFVLTATDIDGEVNGSFKTDSVKVVFSKDDFYKPGDGRWYDGAAKKEILPIALREEAEETNE
ncbi:MAG: radical SAM-associated putative lipoprotein [Tannerellaceae bacterium]|jgi:putative lipoprotein (rSAM/lipoprotein system)|nr:radical SAM-associated putative lipoprotein [Tannerellaceae bacterium]